MNNKLQLDLISGLYLASIDNLKFIVEYSIFY